MAANAVADDVSQEERLHRVLPVQLGAVPFVVARAQRQLQLLQRAVVVITTAALAEEEEDDSGLPISIGLVVGLCIIGACLCCCCYAVFQFQREKSSGLVESSRNSSSKPQKAHTVFHACVFCSTCIWKGAEEHAQVV